MLSMIPVGTFAKVETIPECNLCRTWHHQAVPALYDAMLPSLGRWAFVCATHFFEMSCSLGMGRGQQLVLSPGLGSLGTPLAGE